MTTINNGGPAFPVLEVWAAEAPIREGWNGMTLRDHFAAKAMQSMLVGGIPSDANEKGYIAMHAYKMADEMLRAREAK